MPAVSAQLRLPAIKCYSHFELLLKKNNNCMRPAGIKRLQHIRGGEGPSLCDGIVTIVCKLRGELSAECIGFRLICWDWL